MCVCVCVCNILCELSRGSCEEADNFDSVALKMRAHLSQVVDSSLSSHWRPYCADEAFYCYAGSAATGQGVSFSFRFH